MKRNISIQLKAALLLIVFSLNTVIGFACAMGVDMGFNTHHHDEEEATETTVHVHADGKKHQHHNEAAKHYHDSNKDSEKEQTQTLGQLKRSHGTFAEGSPQKKVRRTHGYL